MRLVYAGGGAPCPTPTRLVLKQQPAGAHNVTVFQGTVCVGGVSLPRLFPCHVYRVTCSRVLRLWGSGPFMTLAIFH